MATNYNIRRAVRAPGASSGGGFGTDTQLVNYYLKKAQATLDDGTINRVEDVDSVIASLAPVAGTVEGATKIAELEAKRNELSTVKNKIKYDVQKFEDDLYTEKQKIIKQSINNPIQMANQLADLYSDKYAEFLDSYYDNFNERYGDNVALSETVANYKNELAKKNLDYITFASSIETIDPRTGEAGAEIPEAFAFTFETNPENGSVIDVDITRTDSIGKEYFKTDSTVDLGSVTDGSGNIVGEYKAVPMYLKGYKTGVDEDGNETYKASIGRVVFEGTKGKNSETAGEFKLIKREGATREDRQARRQTKRNGLDFTTIQAQTPRATDFSVFRVGTDVYAKAPDTGKFYKVPGSTYEEKISNFNGFLSQQGIASVDYVPRLTADVLYENDESLVAGELPIGALPGSQPTSMGPTGAPINPLAEPNPQEVGYTPSSQKGFFKERMQQAGRNAAVMSNPAVAVTAAVTKGAASFFKNKKAEPKNAPTARANTYSVKDVVSKGRDIFNSRTT